MKIHRYLVRRVSHLGLVYRVLVVPRCTLQRTERTNLGLNRRWHVHDAYALGSSRDEDH